jgi:peptidoglycan hydrolase CwlO-like protein
METLEKKRKMLELERVRVAKLEMEFKIEERLADIERLRDNIKNQEKRMSELEEEIKQF